MKLKICGMKYEDNIEKVAALQPDFLGFIFYKPSPRNMTIDVPNIPSNIKRVGVFVDADIEMVKTKIRSHQLDLVQLHGSESPDYCLELKSEGVKIMKVFSVDGQFDFKEIEPFEDVTDFYLFDTKGPLPGGNGYAFDWRHLENYPSQKSYFLSGGIGLEDIEKINAFKSTKASKYCYAIDVNSKFELEPGQKKIEELITFKSQL